MRGPRDIRLYDRTRFRLAAILFTTGEAIVDAGLWLKDRDVVSWGFADRCFGLCLWLMRMGERVLRGKRSRRRLVSGHPIRATEIDLRGNLKDEGD